VSFHTREEEEEEEEKERGRRRKTRNTREEEENKEHVGGGGKQTRLFIFFTNTREERRTRTFIYNRYCWGGAPQRGRARPACHDDCAPPRHRARARESSGSGFRVRALSQSERVIQSIP